MEGVETSLNKHGAVAPVSICPIGYLERLNFQHASFYIKPSDPCNGRELHSQCLLYIEES